MANIRNCLLYTSDAADERSSVDLGGRRIIKKKKYNKKKKTEKKKKKKNKKDDEEVEQRKTRRHRREIQRQYTITTLQATMQTTTIEN